MHLNHVVTLVRGCSLTDVVFVTISESDTFNWLVYMSVHTITIRLSIVGPPKSRCLREA